LEYVFRHIQREFVSDITNFSCFWLKKQVLFLNSSA